jgi:hypothetical protein
MDADGHRELRDLCANYADFCRPVFQTEILKYLRTANRAELKPIRKAVQEREKQLHNHGKSLGPSEQFDVEWLKGINLPVTPLQSRGREHSKRGRPRAHSDWDWIAKAGREAWQRHVLGWTWRKIAEHAGLRPSKENWQGGERILRRRVDQYAALVWNAIPLAARGPAGLREGSLDDRKTQYCLRDKAGLPFDSHPDHCKKLVLKLALRGQKIHARNLVGGDAVVFTR